MPSVLLIDDDPATALLVRSVLEDVGATLKTAATARAGWELASREVPDVVLLDALLPNRSGFEVCGQLHRLDPKLPVIFVAGKGASSTSIEAMRLGAFDFLVKPLDLGELRSRIERALEVGRLAHAPLEVVNAAESSSAEGDLLIGGSPVMRQIYKSIGRMAAQRTPVLIAGETGTGKELVARVLHHYGAQSAAPLVVVHCACRTELEAELFQRVAPRQRADRSRAGKAESAPLGSLFLDEIGDLPMDMQSKLLRLLQEPTCEQPPEPEAADSDFRTIAATCHDLPQMMAAGRFRADLYYHLSGSMLQLPPLRERLEDLPALARHYLKKFSLQFGKRVYRLAPDCLAALLRYRWPGNIRELQSVLRSAVAQATGPVLLADLLPAAILSAADQGQLAPAGAVTHWEALVGPLLQAGADHVFAEAQAEMERHVISLVLKHTGGHQANAAKRLGITRGSLRVKMRALGVVLDRLVDVPADQQPGSEPPAPGADPRAKQSLSD